MCTDGHGHIHIHTHTYTHEDDSNTELRFTSETLGKKHLIATKVQVDIVGFKKYIIWQSIAIIKYFGGSNKFHRCRQLETKKIVHDLSCPAFGIIFPREYTNNS